MVHGLGGWVGNRRSDSTGGAANGMPWNEKYGVDPDDVCLKEPMIGPYGIFTVTFSAMDRSETDHKNKSISGNIFIIALFTTVNIFDEYSFCYATIR